MIDSNRDSLREHNTLRNLLSPIACKCVNLDGSDKSESYSPPLKKKRIRGKLLLQSASSIIKSRNNADTIKHLIKHEKHLIASMKHIHDISYRNNNKYQQALNMKYISKGELYLSTSRMDNNNNNKNDSSVSTKAISNHNVVHNKVITKSNSLPNIKSNYTRLQQQSLITSLLDNVCNVIEDKRNEFNERNNTHKENKQCKPTASVICRKSIDNIPIMIQYPSSYDNYFVSNSERERYYKLFISLYKIKSMIKLDQQNAFKYLKEFIYACGIKHHMYYTKDKLSKLYMYLINSHFPSTINPNQTLRELLLDILNDKLVYSNEKKSKVDLFRFISPNYKPHTHRTHNHNKSHNDNNNNNMYSIIALDKQNINNNNNNDSNRHVNISVDNIRSVKHYLEEELTPSMEELYLKEQTNRKLLYKKRHIYKVLSEYGLGQHLYNYNKVKQNKKLTEFAVYQSLINKPQ